MLTITKQKGEVGVMTLNALTSVRFAVAFGGHMITWSHGHMHTDQDTL